MEKNKHDIAVYAAYIDDEEELLSSTSGGVATALAINMIQNNGFVAGVSYTSDFKGAEYILTNDLEKLKEFKGSKYIEPDFNGIFKKVKEKIQTNKVLFIGLPCIVSGIIKYCNNSDNLFTCELVCHGPISKKVQSDYVEMLEKQYRSKIISFNLRYKEKKWTPPYIRVEFENGSVYMEEFYKSAYCYAFGILGKESCYNCRFKGNNRKGDLTIGDFWGANKEDSFFNDKGVSCLFVETHKGMNLIKESTNLKLFETSFEKAIQKNPMVVSSKERHPKRQVFTDLLLQYELFEAIKMSLTFKEKLKRFLKKILKL